MERAIDGQQRLSRTQREQTVVLPPAIDALLASPIARLVIDPVRVISGLRFVDATAARGVLIDDPNAREGERFARAMGVTLAVDASEVARIPKSGPLIVVSNHPFGFLDAATVCWMLDRQRTDVRFIANRMLQSSSLARSRCFFVDAFGGDRAGNARALRDAMAWVAGGKCLAVFPAGEVMSTPPGSPGPVEADWNIRASPTPWNFGPDLHRSAHSEALVGTPRTVRTAGRLSSRTRRAGWYEHRGCSAAQMRPCRDNLPTDRSAA